MRGHVCRKGKNWYAVVDVGKTEGGKRKQKWFSGFKTKREAQQHLTEVLGQVQRGGYVPPTKQTVSQHLREWLEARRSQLRPRTWGNYERDVRLHINPGLGTRKLAQVTPAMVNGLYGDLLNKGLSPRAVQHVHVVLGRAFEDAVKWGKLVRNPVRQSDAPKPQRRDMETWTATQVVAFLDWCKANEATYRCARHHAAYLLAVTTGMRRGEILGLRWKDVDLANRKLTVTQSLVGHRSEFYFQPPKTQAGLRTIALDGPTVTTLKAHRLANRPNELVFCEADGSPLNPNGFSAGFQSAIKVAAKTVGDLPRVRFHDLRHTYATLALQAQINPKTVQERLGHSNVAITLGIYTHVTDRDHRDAANAVAEAIFGQGA
jgi:integrase